MAKDDKSNNFWNNLRLRHKVLLIVILVSLILVWFFPIVILADIVYIIGYIHGWINACPNCKGFHARKKIETELLDSRDTRKTVTRRMTHKDGRGNVTGTSSYREKVPITLNTIRHHYKCKHCDHTWHGKEKVVEE